MNKKNTKKALFASVLSLLACVALLAGTTFAWFTDSVSSANNKIVSGSLDVELWMYDAAQDKYVDISDSESPIFGEGTAATADNAATLWEPGKTQVAYLAIHNAGSLALKYQVALHVQDVAKNLHEVMEYTITPDAQNGDVTAWDADNAQAVTLGSSIVSGMDVALTAGSTHYFALSIHMKEEAGNEYQNGQVNFDLTVLAGQLSFEESSFGPNYDDPATYPWYGTDEEPVEDNTYLEVFDFVSDDKIATFTVTREAVLDATKPVKATVQNAVPDSTITVADDRQIQTFEVTVTNIKAGNDASILVELFIGENRANVAIYHKDQPVNGFTYNPATGWAKFYTKSFSPFSAVYDVEPFVGGTVILPPTEGTPDDMPVADLVESPEYVGVPIEWGSFGGFSPSNLDQQLEAAFTFSIPDGDYSKYYNWYCDFVVSMDRDVADGVLFLGGCYGDFGWIGFENNGAPVDANVEIPLLGSVTELGWTYEAIDTLVETFICGVAHLDDSLDGATFTVCLRLTNPDNEEQYFDVNTVRYTFPID